MERLFVKPNPLNYSLCALAEMCSTGENLHTVANRIMAYRSSCDLYAMGDVDMAYVDASKRELEEVCVTNLGDRSE